MNNLILCEYERSEYIPSTMKKFQQRLYFLNYPQWRFDSMNRSGDLVNEILFII